MSTTKTGGPAFPSVVERQDDFGELHVSHPGMTLRDYIATKAPITLFHAMQAEGMGSDLLYAMQNNCAQLFDAHTRLCYQWADSMLKTREGNGKC